MTPPTRTEVFQLRVTSDEKRMLLAVAETEGISAADVLRIFIRARYAEHFGVMKPKSKK